MSDHSYPAVAQTLAYYNSAEDRGLAPFTHALYNADLFPDTETYTRRNVAGIKDGESGTWEGKQNIQTFTVGFRSGLSTNGRAYLRNAATPDASNYYEADNEQELIDAFANIFASIHAASQVGKVSTISTATPSIASNALDNLAAVLTLDTGVWSSALRFYKLDENGQPIKTADTQSADYSSRQVIVRTTSNTYLLNSSAQNNHSDFGFAANQKEEFSQAFIPWLARDPQKSDRDIEAIAAKLQNRLIDEYRVRSDNASDEIRQMGDVIDSNILSFEDYVLAGANDGMLYLFKKQNHTQKPYRLLYNYLPTSMPRESASETLGTVLPTIAKQDYGTLDNPHIYGLNGRMVYVKTPKTANRHQQFLLLSTMGQGARGAFALRISGCDSRYSHSEGCHRVGLEANNVLNSLPLWESTQNNDPLGYTISRPTIYPITRQARPNKAILQQNATAIGPISLAGFIANGHPDGARNMPYDSAPTLYVYDLLGEDFSPKAPSTSLPYAQGSLIAKLQVPIGAAAALATPTVVDIDRDGVADLVYAGDYNGNLHRFDLRGEVKDWSATTIYQGNSKQPFTAAPSIYYTADNELIVLIGTGSEIYDADKEDQNRQLYMGIYENLDDLRTTPITTANLLKREYREANGRRKVVPAKLDRTRHEGWYMELAQGSQTQATDSAQIVSSEKVVTQGAIILDTVYFTTRIYGNEKSQTSASASTLQSCSVETSSAKTTGKSWLMQLNVRDGGMASRETGSALTDSEEGDIGKEYPSILSEVTMFRTQFKFTDTPSAIDQNGQVSMGEIDAYDPSKTDERAQHIDCVDKDDYRLLIAKADTSDPIISAQINARVCRKGARLIRLNLRQIIQ